MDFSNPVFDASREDLHYLYASNANVSNVVSVKLSGIHNYCLWKAQMICLMESHDMCSIVDSSNPIGLIAKLEKKYDSLLKGWIFGSISEDVLVNVFNLHSAKNVWEKLDSLYANPPTNSAKTKPEEEESSTGKDAVSAEIEAETKGEISKKTGKEEKDRMKCTGYGNVPLYLDVSNANVSNFVSVKLSGNHNYSLWKTQMLCFLESHNMRGIVDVKVETMTSLEEQYNKLVKGWIFGSVSEDVLGHLVQLKHAKEVWETLQSFFGPTMSSQQATSTAMTSSEDDKDIIKMKNDLRKATIKGRWREVESILKDNKGVEREAISRDGNTILHLAVAISQNDLVDELLRFIKDQDEKEKKDEKASEEKKGKKDKKVNNKKGDKEEEGKKNTEGKENKKQDEGGKGNEGEEGRKDMEGEKGNEGEEGKESEKGDEGEEDRKGKKGKESDEGEEGEKGNEGEVGGKGEKGKEGNEKKTIELKNKEGNTALHIAAIVGNLEAAKLLVKHKELLTIANDKGQMPLHKACSNMQCETFMLLYDPANDVNITNLLKESLPTTTLLEQRPGSSKYTKVGVELLANAISAKQYSTSSELIEKFPKFSTEGDDVLMAVARTFPSALTVVQKFLLPESFDDVQKRTIDATYELFKSFALMIFPWVVVDSDDGFVMAILLILLAVLLGMLLFVYHSIWFLISIVYFPMFLLYLLSWKVATTLAAPIKHIDNRKKEWDGAKGVLILVCDEIHKSENNSFEYGRSIREAACQNAYRVVEEILIRSPEAITSTDENGHDIIQLAVMHRSEKVYNLVYEIGERKSHYKMLEDRSGNNILHLASKLAPSHELNRRRGAALQLQRELQWREEVKKLVFPTYITKKNIFEETPDMVFTREHASLVKEGEKWMKATAESCSITAALITTIVFAAAITVPGGNNQDTGIPLLTKDIAFTIFAISDAVSLFTSSTSLLVFLSILTARFAEQDFLSSLPRRLIIGLYTLLLSATAMMVAFSATLFLMFCHQKPWMLAPICGSACLPIAFFFTVQFPLIIDLFRSTYGRPFGKQRRPNRFSADDVRGYFSK